MSDNGSERLAAIESALARVLAGVGELRTLLQRQADTTARAIETLNRMMKSSETHLINVLEARMAEVVTIPVFEARMAEIITQLRTHTHNAA